MPSAVADEWSSTQVPGLQEAADNERHQQLEDAFNTILSHLVQSSGFRLDTKSSSWDVWSELLDQQESISLIKTLLMRSICSSSSEDDTPTVQSPPTQVMNWREAVDFVQSYLFRSDDMEGDDEPHGAQASFPTPDIGRGDEVLIDDGRLPDNFNAHEDVRPEATIQEDQGNVSSLRTGPATAQPTSAESPEMSRKTLAHGRTKSTSAAPKLNGTIPTPTQSKSLSPQDSIAGPGGFLQRPESLKFSPLKPGNQRRRSASASSAVTEVAGNTEKVAPGGDEGTKE